MLQWGDENAHGNFLPAMINAAIPTALRRLNLVAVQSDKNFHKGMVTAGSFAPFEMHLLENYCGSLQFLKIQTRTMPAISFPRNLKVLKVVLEEISESHIAAISCLVELESLDLQWWPASRTPVRRLSHFDLHMLSSLKRVRLWQLMPESPILPTGVQAFIVHVDASFASLPDWLTKPLPLKRVNLHLPRLGLLSHEFIKTLEEVGIIQSVLDSLHLHCGFYDINKVLYYGWPNVGLSIPHFHALIDLAIFCPSGVSLYIPSWARIENLTVRTSEFRMKFEDAFRFCAQVKILVLEYDHRCVEFFPELTENLDKAGKKWECIKWPWKEFTLEFSLVDPERTERACNHCGLCGECLRIGHFYEW